MANPPWKIEDCHHIVKTMFPIIAQKTLRAFANWAASEAS